ncbi:MAG: histidine phosphatase family protein [Gemmataceae bacterium]
METVLYLIRHGATEANLARPPRLQGRKQDAPLARLGVRQSEATRDLLAIRPVDYCYSSPMLRAVQTAEIVAAPHGIKPRVLEALTECDVGRWENLDWQTIRRSEPDSYKQFMSRPGEFGYPGGETFQQVYDRVAPTLDALFHKHAGQTMLVVAHHIVNRTYLAGLLGLSPDYARQVSLDNCGISVVVHDGEAASLTTLNAAFHIQGVAA